MAPPCACEAARRSTGGKVNHGDQGRVLVSEGTEEFTAIVVPRMVERGRFEVSSDGTVEAVSFADRESATRFVRTGTKAPLSPAQLLLWPVENPE